MVGTTGSALRARGPERWPQPRRPPGADRAAALQGPSERAARQPRACLWPKPPGQMRRPHPYPRKAPGVPAPGCFERPGSQPPDAPTGPPRPLAVAVRGRGQLSALRCAAPAGPPGHRLGLRCHAACAPGPSAPRPRSRPSSVGALPSGPTGAMGERGSRAVLVGWCGSGRPAEAHGCAPTQGAAACALPVPRRAKSTPVLAYSRGPMVAACAIAACEESRVAAVAEPDIAAHACSRLRAWENETVWPWHALFLPRSCAFLVPAFFHLSPDGWVPASGLGDPRATSAPERSERPRTGIFGDTAGIFSDIANNDYALERSVRSRTSRCAGAARCVAVRAQVAAGAAWTHR